MFKVGTYQSSYFGTYPLILQWKKSWNFEFWASKSVFFLCFFLNSWEQYHFWMALLDKSRTRGLLPELKVVFGESWTGAQARECIDSWSRNVGSFLLGVCPTIGGISDQKRPHTLLTNATYHVTNRQSMALFQLGKCSNTPFSITTYYHLPFTEPL